MGTESAPKTATHIALSLKPCTLHLTSISFSLTKFWPKNRKVEMYLGHMNALASYSRNELTNWIFHLLSIWVEFLYAENLRHLIFWLWLFCDVKRALGNFLLLTSDAQAEIFNVISLASMIQQLFYHFNGTRDFFPSEHNNFMLAFGHENIPRTLPYQSHEATPKR